MLRHAYLLTGDRADAADLLQSALLKVYLAWHRIDDLGSVDGYVRTTMARQASSWWRAARHRRETKVAEPDAGRRDPAATDALDRVADHDEVWRLLGRLGPRQRAVVVLRYADDLSEQQIADALGCSIGTVKSQLSRALATLRPAAQNLRLDGSLR